MKSNFKKIYSNTIGLLTIFNMSKFPYAVKIIIIGTAFTVMASTMSMSFLAIHMNRELGFSPTIIGTIFAFGAVAGIFGSFISGALSDFIGRAKILIISIIILGFLYIILQYATTVTQFFILDISLSLVSSAFEPVIRAILSEYVQEDIRHEVFSARYQAVNLGFAIGPITGAYLGLVGTSYSFIITGIIYLIFGMILTSIYKKIFNSLVTVDDQKEQLHFSDLKCLLYDKKLQIFILGSTLSVMVYGQIGVNFSQYLANSFVDGIKIFAVLMSVNALSVVFLQQFISRLTRKNSPLTAVIYGSLMLVFSQLGFAFSHTTGFLIFSMVVFTIGEIMIVPAEYILIDMIAPDSLKGSYFGAHALSGVGGVGGLVLGGFILTNYGGVPMFLSYALIATISIGIFLTAKKL